MAFADLTAWRVILGLSLMSVGGLVLWAYGARRTGSVVASLGPEAEATRNFHLNLVRWFFIYGVLVIAAGTLLLLWAGSVFI
jgi:multisubunit Na+/H+ antiporter MnhC subunit